MFLFLSASQTDNDCVLPPSSPLCNEKHNSVSSDAATQGDDSEEFSNDRIHQMELDPSMLLVSEDKDDWKDGRWCRYKLFDETLEQTPNFCEQWSGNYRFHIGRLGNVRHAWDQDKTFGLFQLFMQKCW